MLIILVLILASAVFFCIFAADSNHLMIKEDAESDRKNP
jgi:hypothetical protein